MAGLARYPNVLFMLVDALWYDRLAVSGHSPPAGTHIDSLAEQGLLATQLFATGCPTQFAFPSIFTSTLPLDDGGYGSGIRFRGRSFVECLKEAGFSTAAFVSAGYGSRYNGYDRGFDTFHEFFDLSLFTRIIRDYLIGYYATLLSEKVISKETWFERIGPVLERAFPALARFCLDKMEELASSAAIRSPIIHSWDFGHVARTVQGEQAAFASDPRLYMEKLLGQWQTHPLFGAIASARTAPQAASGAYVAEHAMRWIDRQKAGPFFVWTHFMDVHDSSYSTYDYLQPRNQLQQEMARIMDIHAKIEQEGAAYRSDRGHDYALAYCDEQVGKLVAFLEAKKILGNTLIVIASDHGSRTAGQPRPDFKDITAFFDQLYHVPFILVHPNLPPQRIDSLCSIMDIGPTLLDILEIGLPASWRGAPVYSAEAAQREHLVMEHVGRGPCDIDIKPINVCVRTKNMKAVFTSRPAAAALPPAVAEVYDLAGDRDEKNNLAPARADDMAVQRLRSIAERRIAHIREGMKNAASAAA